MRSIVPSGSRQPSATFSAVSSIHLDHQGIGSDSDRLAPAAPSDPRRPTVPSVHGAKQRQRPILALSHSFSAERPLTPAREDAGSTKNKKLSMLEPKWQQLRQVLY